MSTIKIQIIFFTILATVTFETIAGFRCDSGRLVQVGDKTFDVLEYCGTPFATQNFGVVEIDEKDVNLERWTYVSSKGKLVRYLEFHNGVVANISAGQRIK